MISAKKQKSSAPGQASSVDGMPVAGLEIGVVALCLLKTQWTLQMAIVSDETVKYLSQVNKPTEEHWTHAYEIGERVPVSGIYRCIHCNDEITSNKGDEFPPQNKAQHPDQTKSVLWQLVVLTQTKG